MLEYLVDAVGIEPATCRFGAVRMFLAPAATDCYKVLSFVHFSLYLPPVNCYLYSQNNALF